MDTAAQYATDRRLVILIPVFDEWRALQLLLREIDLRVAGVGWRVSVLLVDDGSTEELPVESFCGSGSGFERIDVLGLRKNIGQQRAIAVGLAYLEKNIPCDAVVVMDGDGEDSPADIPRLLARFDALGGTRVVFAARARRSEGLVFKFFYRLYRLAHRALTGISVRVGSFCVLPISAVGKLVVSSDLWNHFAASVFKARLPLDMVATNRGVRLAGQSKMNFTALVIHGLSAISVFGERVGVRGMLFAGIFFVFAAFGLFGVVLSRLFTDWAIPGWASLTSGLLVVLALQLLIGIAVFAFIILASRDSASFLPNRDHIYFIREVIRLWPGRGGEEDRD